MMRAMGKRLPALLSKAFGARLAATAAFVCLALSPNSAQAMQPQLWGFVPTCALLGASGAPPASVAPLVASKASVILGGAQSKLELLRAAQNETPVPGAGPMAQQQLGLSCASPVAAATPSQTLTSSFASLRPALQTTTPSTPGSGLGFAQPRVPMPDNGRPDVFGSVALAVGQTPLDQRWNNVRGARVSANGGPWSKLVKSQRGQSDAAKIAAVNAWVNARISFADDIKAVGVSDQWASAAQSLRRGRGDCEDYAIAKMQILSTLGIDSADMYLVIARDLVRQADHAVLVVRTDGQLLVLDNGTDRIVDARATQDYRPIMSYSGNRSWLHGYPLEPRQNAGPIQTASLR
jgi:predicted transglutaminase-like cysteine proteinase